MFQLQLEKLKVSWEAQAQHEQHSELVRSYEEQLSSCRAEVERLNLLLHLKSDESQSCRHGKEMVEVGCQTVSPQDAAFKDVAIGTDMEGVKEELIPLSKVEILIDETTTRLLKNSEDVTRTICTELRSRFNEETTQLRQQLEEVTVQLCNEREKSNSMELALELKSGQTSDYCLPHVEDELDKEVLHWMPGFDSGSELSEPELEVGMVVQVYGLTSRPELNGRQGKLLKYDLERDRWQVDLGVDLGIKLLRSTSLLAHRQQEDAPSQTDVGKCRLHRNDLALPSNPDGSVDWKSVLPEDAFKEFCASQLLGSYNCRECRDDIASCPQSYGYVQCLRQDGGWEEAHLLNLIDEDAIVQCLPCHYSTISCKFYARGWCMRGADCAYMHTLPT